MAPFTDGVHILVSRRWPQIAALQQGGCYHAIHGFIGVVLRLSANSEIFPKIVLSFLAEIC